MTTTLPSEIASLARLADHSSCQEITSVISEFSSSQIAEIAMASGKEDTVDKLMNAVLEDAHAKKTKELEETEQWQNIVQMVSDFEKTGKRDMKQLIHLQHFIKNQIVTSSFIISKFTQVKTQCDNMSFESSLAQAALNPLLLQLQKEESNLTFLRSANKVLLEAMTSMMDDIPE
jgi:hypothetical protein